MESAGIRFYRKRSSRTVGITPPGAGSGGSRQGTDPLLALGTARPLGLKNGNCLDTYELLNNSGLRASELLKGGRWLGTIAVGSLAVAEKVKASRAEAGRELDGGVLPLLMSIGRIGSTKIRRWR